MSNGQHETQGVYRIRTDGSWLCGSKIYACAVQPPEPTLETMVRDGPRPEALKLAEALLTPQQREQRPRITTWSRKKPAIVVFPELAFSTDDFDQLDGWITTLPSPVIVLAGFGFCSGERLARLLQEHRDLQPAWPRSDPPDPDGTYNGGWCWLHRPDGQDLRVVFLKNFAEQKVEVAKVDDWTPGTHILRLETGDLTLFPLICADLIQDPEDKASPRARIGRSLEADPPRGDILVVGLLHADSTSSDFWKQALNDLTPLGGRGRLAVFLVNQARPEPCEDEEQDKWRSLTGAFLSIPHMPDGPPRPNLAHVRYVKTDEARGLLLRRTENPGVAAGPLRWHCAPNSGRYVWNPNRRFSWSEAKLVQESGTVEAWELSRLLVRQRKSLTKRIHERLDSTFESRLAETRRRLEQESGAEWIGNLWPQLLEGPVSAKDVKSTPDQLHKFSAPLSRALRILAAFCHEDLAERVIDPKVKDLEESKPKLKAHLCLLDSKSHIAIWSDPKLDPDDQIRKLEKYVSNPGRTLFVLGAGAGGVNPERQEIGSEQKDVDSKRQKVVQGPRSNIGRASRLGPSRDESPIDKPRKSARNIWWINLGFFEVILKDASWIEIPAAQASSELNERLRKKIL